MKRIGHVIFALLLLAFWAAISSAAEPRHSSGYSLCIDDQHLTAILSRLFSPQVDDISHRLLSGPRIERQKKMEDAEVQVDSVEDMVALAFRNDNGFTPYVGAGINPLPPAGIPPEPTYRLGAGFARLNMGYRFSTNGGRSFDGLLGPEQGVDQDRFDLSFGIQKSF
jgi:hypothetical protein